MSAVPLNAGSAAPADSASEAAVPDTGARSWAAYARPALAVVLSLPAVVLSMVPTLRFDHWDWVALLLALPVVLYVVGCTVADHRGGASAGSRTLEVLASVALIGTVAWAAPAVLDQRTDQQLVGVVVAALVVIAREVATRSGAQIGGEIPRWFVPSLLALIAAATAIWWIVDGGPEAAAVGMAALIAACPAALIAAAPGALMTGSRRGAASGVRLTSLTALHTAARVDTIVLDQRGTVTTGDLTVISAEPIDPQHERNLRWFAGALEHASDHPIARAVAKLSGAGRVTDVQHHAGAGISGSVDRHPVRVGRPDWIGLTSDAPPGRGHTVAVEVDGRALGHVTVADELRPQARDAVDKLRALGLEPVLVSSGSVHDVDHIATATGIERTHAGLDDPARRAVIEELRGNGRVVAMVAATDTSPLGLAAADLAMTDTELPTGLAMADVDASTAGRALRIARATLATAQLNRRIAAAGLLLGVTLAVAGLIDPAQAAIVAVASSLAVAVNTLRMRHESAS